MGIVKIPSKGALIAGIIFSGDNLPEEVIQSLEEKFGPVEMKSEVFDFDMTNYYTPEMGENLRKIFLCFAEPIRLESLSEIKLITNEIELRFAGGNSEQPLRTVNIDPGYIVMSKLVLATTKDYSHRIYIGRGIFAETTLRFVGKSFAPVETT